MKNSTKLITIALIFGLTAGSAFAQDQQRRGPGQDGNRGPGQDGQRGGFGGDRGGRGGFTPPPNPLATALDTDNDGELSAAEIANAVAALKSLDKDGDGKISREEMRPQFGGGDRGGMRGGDRGGQGGGFGEGSFADRMMAYDTNKDGKVSKDELPERMQRIMDNADTDKDGSLSKAEIDALGARFGGGRGGDRGGDRGGREGGDNNRPARPERPGFDN